MEVIARGSLRGAVCRGLGGGLSHCVIGIAHKSLFMFSWENFAGEWDELGLRKKKEHQAMIHNLPQSSSTGEKNAYFAHLYKTSSRESQLH